MNGWTPSNRTSITGRAMTQCDRDSIFGFRLGRCYKCGRGNDCKITRDKELPQRDFHTAGPVLFLAQEEFSFRIAENQIVTDAQCSARHRLAVLVQYAPDDNVFGELEIRS